MVIFVIVEVVGKIFWKLEEVVDVRGIFCIWIWEIVWIVVGIVFIVFLIEDWLYGFLVFESLFCIGVVLFL